MAINNADFSLVRVTWDVMIAFLALLGDVVILYANGVLFVLKKTFSLLKMALYRIAVIKKLRLKSPTTPPSKISPQSPFLIFFTALKKAGLILFFRLLIFKEIKARQFETFFTALLPAASSMIKKGVISFLHFLRLFVLQLGKKTYQLIRLMYRVTKIRINPPHISFRPPPLPSFPKPRLIFPRPPSLMVGLTGGVLLTMIFVFVPYYLYVFVKSLPHPRLLSQRVIPVTTQIFDRHGTLLYEIHGDEDRKPIKLADIPESVKQATIAIEDKAFYSHPGFSIAGIARAARENVVDHELQGGSTITQQLIKNSLLTSEISLWRKAREVFLAFWAERLYTKDEILEMYLNQVPYGGTAWGIEAAAETYFGKSVDDLSVAESAYLAGLTAAPSFYSPYGAHPELAKKRQEAVLRRMEEDRYLSQAQAEAAKNELLPLKSHISPIKAPHFVMYVRQLLTQLYGERAVAQGGLRVITTLDLPLQEKVQSIVSSEVSKLASLSVGNGAAVVTDPKTGEILAMVGSKDYFNAADDGNVNVAISERQPGSSIKVVTYAAALEKGLTAASIIDDSPVSYPIAGQPAYAPVNYDGRFHGRVTLRSALANSYNIPAVKTLNQIGLPSMIEVGQKMGISTWDDTSRFGLSLTLGGGEVTLLDMAEVYGTLANKGSRVKLDPFIKITDYTGKTPYERKNSATKVLSEETAFIISDILADNAARTPAFGPSSALVVPGKTVAVKTGTTNDKRDNWTMGYTPSYVVGVWVGNNNNSPMNPVLTSGVTGAAPIWNQIMKELLKDKGDEKYSSPGSLVKIPCFGKSEYFIRGTEPKDGCRAPFPTPPAAQH